MGYNNYNKRDNNSTTSHGIHIKLTDHRQMQHDPCHQITYRKEYFEKIFKKTDPSSIEKTHSSYRKK